jgi:phage-related minor tail protein
MEKFGFTAVIGADYSALNNAMKEIDSSSKKLNSELKQINSALKLDPENAVLAAQKLEVMGDAAKEAQKKIEKLEFQQEAMNKALQNGDISAEYYREYQREIEKAERTVREFTKAQNEAQKAAEDSAQALAEAQKAAENPAHTLREALKEIDSSSKELKIEMEQINSALKLDPENIMLAAQKMEVLKQSAEQAEKKLAELTKQQEAMNAALNAGEISDSDYREYQREIEKCSRTIKEYRQANEQAANAAQKQSNAFEELKSSSADLDKTYTNALNELKEVRSAMNSTGESSVLFRQKMQLLQTASDALKAKLEMLKNAQEQMKSAFENGNISGEEYREFQREIENTTAELKLLGNEAPNASQSVGGFGDTVKAIITSKAIIGLAEGAKAAAEALIDLGKSSVESYGELEQNLGGADAVFGQYSESIKKTAEDAYKTMGTSQSEYLATANKMGALFQGSGVEQQKSLELTEKAMQRATDMASVMGIETSAALEAVTGAAKGNYTMMDNLGVAMNATTLKAYALSKGLDVTWDSASNAQKAEIAMQYFFENTEQYAGNFEREARETVSGSIGLLTASIESLMAGLGNSEADIVNLTQNVIDAFGSVKDNVMPVLQAVSDALPQVAQELVEAIPEVIPEVAGMAEEIIAALGEGLEAQLPNITDMAVELLTAFAQKLTEALPAIADGAVLIVTTLADGIGEALPDLVPAAVEAVVKIAESLLDNIDVILDAAIKLIEGLTEGLFRALPGLLQEAPTIIAKLGTALIDAAYEIIIGVPEAIVNGIVDGLGGYDWTGGADKAIGNLKAALDKAAEKWNISEIWADKIVADDGYEVLGSQDEADARLDAALKELEEKRGQIPEKYRQIQEELKKGAEETADKLADTSTEIAEAAGTAADVGVSETNSENGGDESGVNQKSDMLDKELEELEHKYKTHKVTEEQYWSERKSTLEKYRDDDSEEWNALYDKVTEHYTKLAEAEKKAKEAALKEDTAEAKKRFDALYSQLSDEKITREQFNDEYAALTEELAQKQIDISEYAADKIASYDEKVRKEKMTAWEKASKEITDKITKTYENVTQAYEKAKSQLISSAKLIDQKVTDTSGADRYILTDFEKKRKELAKYRKDLEKLKETGISDDLMEQVMRLNYDSGERQGYISELLKMSDSQRKKYYKDVDAFYADAGKTAAFEVQDDLTEADRIAKEGIESIYGSMPADAYQKGVETAQSYIDGINKTMADADALRSMGSDFGERSQNSKMQSAASGSSGSTYSPSGTAQGGKSSFYSGDTKIVINVAGKNVIVSTIEELIRKGRLADSRR